MSGLTLVSFFLMVGSSVIAAWADISTSLATASMAMTKGANGMAVIDPTSGAEVPLELALDGSGSVPIADVLGRVNVGYLWMFVNCVASAAYVSDHAQVEDWAWAWAWAWAGTKIACHGHPENEMP